MATDLETPLEKICEDLCVRIGEAERRLRPRIPRTPLLPVRSFAPPEAELYLKLETEQETGSFKLRGATHRLMVLSQEERSLGVVTASSGNHGLAVCHAAEHLALPLTVVVPETIAPEKKKRLESYDAELLLIGQDGVESERAARELAGKTGRTYVSPYNDLDVVAGQGGVGVEIFQQLPEVERVYVTVGGGGLIAGTAAWLKSRRPEIVVVGCQPANSAVMAHSLAAGRILELKSSETLSDGSAGGIEQDAVTFEPCQQLIDEVELIEEDDIARTMAALAKTESLRVEGAAAVALAAWQRQQQERERLGKPSVPSVVVLCGKNVSSQSFDEVMAQYG